MRPQIVPMMEMRVRNNSAPRLPRNNKPSEPRTTVEPVRCVREPVEYRPGVDRERGLVLEEVAVRHGAVYNAPGVVEAQPEEAAHDHILGRIGK